MSDKVRLTHPDVEGTIERSRDSFEDVWESKGWIIQSEDEPTGALDPDDQDQPDQSNEGAI